MATRCKNSKKHAGPFFTVTVTSLEVGRGSRIPGRKRASVRRVLKTLCAKCMGFEQIEVEGKSLVPAA